MTKITQYYFESTMTEEEEKRTIKNLTCRADSNIGIYVHVNNNYKIYNNPITFIINNPEVTFTIPRSAMKHSKIFIINNFLFGKKRGI